MDEIFDLMKRQAHDLRNVAISAARREYFAAMKAIRELERRVREESRGRIRLSAYDQPLGTVTKACRGKTMMAAATEILSEGRPMTLAELTLEVQRRGLRTRDDPRVLSKGVRATLACRDKRFKKDETGRWSVVHNVG